MLKSYRLYQWAFVLLVLLIFALCLTCGDLDASAETIVTDEPGFINAINSAETLIVVANDISLTRGYRISRDLTIRSSASAALRWGGPANRTVFIVDNDANFTLADIALDGDGKYVKMVKVEGATFTMQDGAVLRNQLSNGSNRAVTIGDSTDAGMGGTFNMTGGLITGVSMDAVVIGYNCTIHMSGTASISDNGAYGIGIISSTLNMTGNASISDNTAARPGAGVLAGYNSVINMGLSVGDAPRISGNTSTSNYGGGVYLVDSELNMGFGASISDNTAETLGGGVALNNSPLSMTGEAKISGNTTRAGAGGGIFASASTVDLSDEASVFGNTATADDSLGGGIYLQNEASLTISGPVAVYDNRAAYGAGIYLNDGTDLIMTGGVIRANVAQYDGGGIYTKDIANYLNLTTDDATRFSGNLASEAYTPPEDALSLYPHIRFATTSIADHPLNNYDIFLTGTEVLRFHVTYRGNGGRGYHTGLDIKPSYTDTILPQQETGIRRVGFTFTGWNTEPDGSGHAYAPGDTITLNNNATLYAQWVISDTVRRVCFALFLLLMTLMGYCVMWPYCRRER